MVYLTPRPIYVVQYDLKKDTWEVKTAKSVDEAAAYLGLSTSDIGLPTSDVYKVSMGTKPDFWESNWYKVLTATAVAVGIYSSLK